MAEQKWLTAMEAAQWLGRSVHTIYTWIRQARRGEAGRVLELKPRPGYGRKERQSWLIEAESLLSVHGQSPQSKRPPARPSLAKPESRLDTVQAVQADRKKWVRGWVAEGKPLIRILSVFDNSLHSEIEWYYKQAVREKGRRPGEGDDPA